MGENRVAGRPDANLMCANIAVEMMGLLKLGLGCTRRCQQGNYTGAQTCSSHGHPAEERRDFLTVGAILHAPAS